MGEGLPLSLTGDNSGAGRRRGPGRRGMLPGCLPFLAQTSSGEEGSRHAEASISSIKKSRIRETPTLLTDADSRTDTNLKRLRDLYVYILFFFYFFFFLEVE